MTDRDHVESRHPLSDPVELPAATRTEHSFRRENT